MKISSLAGAFVAGWIATTAQAETVRYTFDQAFWGFKPLNVDAATWQAGREADVAANPGDFRYMTGSFDFDTLYGLPTNVSLTVDYGPASHTFASSGPYSDPRFTTDTRGTDFTIFTFGFDITEGFGDMLTFGADTDERYSATLNLDFVYHKATQELTMRASAYLREFESRFVTEYCYNPYAGNEPAGSCGVAREVGAYQNVPGTYLFADVFGLPAGSTNVVTGPGASPVPLPATGALLLSTCMLGAALRRGRKSA